MNNFINKNKNALVVISIIMISCLQTHIANAQIPATKAPSGRNSITVLFVNYSSGDPILHSVYNNYYMPDRFDINDIGSRFLEVPVSISQSSTVSTIIEDQVYDQRIPNKILRNVLINESLGYMTTETLEERGLYSASDADVLVAKNTVLGMNVLRDNGSALLNNIYFVVVTPDDILTTYEKNTGGTIYTLSGSTYLYKLDISSMLESGQFWDEFYFDKPNNERMEKLMNYQFPVTRVSTAYFSPWVSNINAAGKIGLIGNFITKLSTGVNGTVDVSSSSNFKSTKEIHTDLLKKAMEKSFEQFESLLGGFSINQSIFSARPLQVKIGKKEGLRPDDLFEVTEKVMNTKTGVTTTEHVGYIRARKVAKNRYQSKGKTKPSVFYRVASEGIRKGMEVTKSDDKKYVIGFSYNPEPSSILGGYYMNLEYVTHWWAGMRIGVDAGYGQLQTSKVSTTSGGKVNGHFTGDAFTGIISLRPSINFHRLSFIPVGGIYYSYMPITSSTIMSSTELSKYTGLQSTELGAVAGGDIGINLGKILQLRAGYRKTFGLNTSKDDGNSFSYNLEFTKPTYTFGIRLFGL